MLASQHSRSGVWPRCAGIAIAVTMLTACRTPPPPLDPNDPVERGERLFFSETFAGNGRTCGTCHRTEDNFGLSPAFIATLPPEDPLFIAERDPNLARNFENPRLMRQFGLILENLDGFDALDGRFTMRGIPHTLALRTSVASREGPRTGWSGDGSPGDGSLRAFSVGAVIQHFTRTLNRVAGIDFRLPTDAELADLEAFMLSLGRQQDPVLPLRLKGVVATRGQAIFLDNNLGKCNACHFNAGANANPAVFGPGAGNRNFATGVEELADQPARLTAELVPADDGFGIPGNGEFNTPPLVEAADTGPFFHNNSIETIEGAVAFFNGVAFNNSPAGRAIAAATGGGISLEGTQVVAVAAFLRVLNALENVRQSVELIERSAKAANRDRGRELLNRAGHEAQDAAQVLQAAGLHPQSAMHLNRALASIGQARVARMQARRSRLSAQALEQLRLARRELIDE